MFVKVSAYIFPVKKQTNKSHLQSEFKQFFVSITHQKYSKTCVKWPLSKRPKIGFQDQLSLNAGQKYCRMHSAILSAFIKLPFVIKIFVLSVFECLFYTGFTVNSKTRTHTHTNLVYSTSILHFRYGGQYKLIFLRKKHTLLKRHSKLAADDNLKCCCFFEKSNKTWMFHVNSLLAEDSHNMSILFAKNQERYLKSCRLLQTL